MTGAKGEKEKSSTAAHASLGFTLPFADKAPVSPVEFMTAATAAGMAVGLQFANAFFGIMQASLDTANRPTSGPDEAVPAEKAAELQSAQPLDREVEAVAVAPEMVKTHAPRSSAKPPSSKRSAKSAKSEIATAASPVLQEQLSEAAKPKRTAAPRKASKAADDLKKISGIGPKLESLLNGMGVLRYSHIAGWTDKDVEHIDRELGLDGRVTKDGWIAQAKALLR